MNSFRLKFNYWIFCVIVSFFFLNISCKSNRLPPSNNSNGFFELTQIKTDTLYQSNQQINIIKISNDTNAPYKIEIGYAKTDLKITSNFGKNKNALGAINGGFFDMDNGGSVAYLELNDSVINYTLNPQKKWAKSDSLINGSIIIYKNNDMVILPKRTDQYYKNSKKEKGVILTGPLLIQNSKKSKLFDSKFVNNRHPRTCLCKTKKSILFITIDGRRENAQGMNLFELQDFLLNLGCLDAINLDGGGSTTMWTHKNGVVNQPSDKTGERPVSNVLLIMEKEKNIP